APGPAAAAADGPADGRGAVPAPGAAVPAPRAGEGPLLPPEARLRIQRAMTEGAGVLRSADSLARAAERLAALPAELADKPAEPGTETWETANLHLVARTLVAAAQLRTETRGCHWREDFPERDDAHWRRHIVVRLPLNDADIRMTDTTAFPPVATKESNP
ncbi:L-aspartate oxidase, partial [Streptomyces sp. SB3404]|nr:L-aspartate oxidase [Streptomyces boncukensis]